jgi:ssDNA-binding Zn-finger/Zn-ribbon topoisomerase 1
MKVIKSGKTKEVQQWTVVCDNCQAELEITSGDMWKEWHGGRDDGAMFGCAMCPECKNTVEVLNINEDRFLVHLLLDKQRYKDSYDVYGH